MNHYPLCKCVCEYLKLTIAQGQQTSLRPTPTHVVAGSALA